MYAQYEVDDVPWRSSNKLRTEAKSSVADRNVYCGCKSRRKRHSGEDERINHVKAHYRLVRRKEKGTKPDER